jgi:hypothetical protein
MERLEGCPLLGVQEVPTSNLGSPTKTQHAWCAVSRGQLNARVLGHYTASTNCACRNAITGK